MTTEEKIKVMQAYLDGKTIQCRNGIFPTKWADTPEPLWDWGIWEFRIKPESRYMPYKSTTEMINDFCERFGVERKNCEEPAIWVKHLGMRKMIVEYDEYAVKISSGNEVIVWNMKNLFESCFYLDGSPVGKLVEE